MISVRHRVPWQALVALLSFSVLPGARPQQDDYILVDRVEGEQVSFNSVPRRPMVVIGTHLYALNTHGSTVLDYDLAAAQPDVPDVYPVPKSPVSLAAWGNKLVVVCDGSYCLLIMDVTTAGAKGKILKLLELRNGSTGPIQGEPADLLVDETANRAFVSCSAADAVLEINLVTAAVVRKFDLPAKSPVFMTFDANKDVLVAPLLSGNNSGARRHPSEPLQHAGPTVVDFADPVDGDQIGTGLPDRDLFRCIRSSGAVQAITTGMGTVMFAVGVHASGKIWQLNTEANNKDPDAQSVGDIQGNFVRNRLSIADSHLSGSLPKTPSSEKVLDQTPYTDTTAVGQPYGLTFIPNPPLNQAVVTGLLTDNFVVLDQNGDLVREYDVREKDAQGNTVVVEGSIPRASLFYHDAAANKDWLFIYCWGTNEIQAYRYTWNMLPEYTLDLGYDPTPAEVKEGRRIFYDAAHSENKDSSCASCHVDGHTDMVVWNLGAPGVDDKGPMLTQTLAGIERMVPFHWRGEQQGNPNDSNPSHLKDFNGAFVDLLGGTKLSDSDFDLFQKFVFSIQNRPNPFQNETRVVDDAIAPTLPTLPPPGLPAPSAIAGQNKFLQRCESCHNFPSGTNNDIVATGNSIAGEENPRRQNFKVAPFHDLYKREQDASKLTSGLQTIEITLNPLSGSGPDETFEYPLLGAGFSHAGLHGSVVDFVERVFDFTTTEDRNLASFLFQWDQGLAPATYRVVLLDQPNYSATALDYLITQAEARNCDIGVFGTTQAHGAIRWSYSRRLDQFVSDKASVANVAASVFLGEAQNGTGHNVFVGLPVGSGDRFAIDYDGDGLRNQDDGAPYVMASAAGDNTAPTITRRETVMITGEVARINVETSEPCTLEITFEGTYLDEFTLATGPTPEVETAVVTSVPARTHSVLLNRLKQSTIEDVDSNPNVTDWRARPWITYGETNPLFGIVAKDRNGNVSVKEAITSMVWPLDMQGSPGSPIPVPPPLTTRKFNPDGQVEVHTLSWTQAPGTTTTGTASLVVRNEAGGPPVELRADMRVIARLFVNGVLVDGTGSTNFTPQNGSLQWSGFDHPIQDPNGPLGTFIDVPYTGLPGPFLVSPQTSSSGATTLSFLLSGVSAGDDVRLNIELIGEPTTATSTVLKGIAAWSMPGTSARNRGLDAELP